MQKQDIQKIDDSTAKAIIANTNTHVKLKDSERQRCEVWTRVMGYHRPVSSFNIGKKASIESGNISARLKWKNPKNHDEVREGL